MVLTPRFLRPQLAAAALLGAGLAACGAGSSPAVAHLAGASATPSPTADVATILTRFAQCARDHGATGLPDPTIDAQGQPDFRPMKVALGAMPQAVQRQVANSCQSILAALPPPPPPDAATLQALVTFAGCMRSHGLADFPDPDPQSGRFILPADIDPKSSVANAAYDACKSSVPNGVNIRYSSQSTR